MVNYKLGNEMRKMCSCHVHCVMHVGQCSDRNQTYDHQ